MKKFLYYFFTVSFLILNFAGQSNAVFFQYDSRAAFDADIGLFGLIDQQTVDFEGQTAGDLIPSANSVDGVTFTYSIGADTIMVDNFFDTTSPVNYIGLDNAETAFIYGDSFTMTFDRTINAVGLYVISEPFAIFEDDFELSTPTTSSAFNSGLPDVTLFDGSEAFFIGLIETDPSLGFTSATLISTLFDPDANYVFNVDDITTAAVPEPATLLLVGSGMAGLLGIRRKIKK